MAWNWKADLAALVSWSFRVVGEAMIIAGGAIAALLKFGMVSVASLKDKTIFYSFKSSPDIKTVTYVDLAPPGVTPIHAGPFYQNFTKHFSAKDHITPIQSDTDFEDQLDRIYKLSFVAILIGGVLEFAGICLAMSSSNRRRNEAKENYDKGEANKLSASKVKVCHAISSVLHTSSTAMASAALMMLSYEQGMKALSVLPANYIINFPAFLINGLFNFIFNIEGIAVSADIDVNVKTANTSAIVDLSQIKEGIDEINNALSLVVSVVLLGGAMLLRFFAAKLDQWIKYYYDFEEISDLPNNLDNRPRQTEMGYRQLVIST